MRTKNASQKMTRSRKKSPTPTKTNDTNYELSFQKITSPLHNSHDTYAFSCNYDHNSQEESKITRMELKSGENELHLLWENAFESDTTCVLKDRIPKAGIYLDIDDTYLILKDCREMDNINDWSLYIHRKGEEEGTEDTDLIWEKVHYRQSRVLTCDDVILFRWNSVDRKTTFEYKCQLVCTSGLEDNTVLEEETEMEQETMIVNLEDDVLLGNKDASSDNQITEIDHSVIDIDDDDSETIQSTQAFPVIDDCDEKESQVLSLDLLPNKLETIPEVENKEKIVNSIQEIIKDAKEEDECSSSSSTTAASFQNKGSPGTITTDKFFTASSMLTSSPNDKTDDRSSPVTKKEKGTPTSSNVLQKISSTNPEQSEKEDTSYETCKAKETKPQDKTEVAKDESIEAKDTTTQSKNKDESEKVIEAKENTTSKSHKESTISPKAKAKTNEELSSTNKINQVDINVTPPASNMHKHTNSKQPPSQESTQERRSTRRSTRSTIADELEREIDPETHDTFEFKSDNQLGAIQSTITPTRSCKRKYGKVSPSSLQKDSEKKSPAAKRTRRSKAKDVAEETPETIKAKSKRGRKPSTTPLNKIEEDEKEAPKRGRRASTPKEKIKEEPFETAPKRGRKSTKKPLIKSEETKVEESVETPPPKRGRKSTKKPIIKEETNVEESIETPPTKQGRKSTKKPAIKEEESSPPIRILITGVNVTPKMKKTISSIPNASIINNLSQAKHATHLIASLDHSTSLRRTPKLMIGLNVTKYILYSTWLSSEHEKVEDHLIREDAIAQDKYNFKFSETRANFQYVHSQRSGLLSNYTCHFSKHLSFDKIPSLKELEYIVESAGGTVLKKLKSNEKNIFIFVNESMSKRDVNQIEDFGYNEKEHCRTVSWLFQCIMNQKLNGIDTF